MSDLLQRAAGDFLAWATSMAWQAALLVVVVELLDRMLCRAPAVLRHGLWMLVAVRLLLPASLASPLALLPGAAPDPVPAPALGPATQATVEAPPLWPFVLWGAGLVACLLVAARRSRRRLAAWRAGALAPDRALLAALAAAAARAGLARPPRLLLTASAPGVLVMGLLNPVLVLPAALLRRRSDALEHVLLHECTHVKRRDLWSEALFACASLLFWWHPLVGWARRRARDVREQACDAGVAVRLGAGAGAYRTTLLRLALEAPGAEGVGTAFLPRPYGVAARLRALERGAPRVTGWTRAAAVLLPLLLGAALLPRARASFTPADEREAARAQLSALLAGPEKPGCFALRYAVLRCVVAEEHAAASR